MSLQGTTTQEIEHYISVPDGAVLYTRVFPGVGLRRGLCFFITHPYGPLGIFSFKISLHFYYTNHPVMENC